MLSLIWLIACPALAAEQPTMVISGVGQGFTPPDVAKPSFSVRGEGTSPDAATSALVKTMDAIRSGLGSLPNVELNITTDEMRVQSVRGEDCGTLYDEAKLSAGSCAVKGYVATREMIAQVSPAEEVGTMLGLASRLGADSTSVAQFDLRNPSDAQRRATALALVDAQKKAQMIADGAGVKLGSVVNVADSEALTMDLQTARQREEPSRRPAEPAIAPACSGCPPSGVRCDEGAACCHLQHIAQVILASAPSHWGRTRQRARRDSPLDWWQSWGDERQSFFVVSSECHSSDIGRRVTL